MKYIGIDYGTKRVGIALSDEGGMLAFPHSVLTNDKDLAENVKNVCEEESVSAIVMGESLDSAGAPNSIMENILPFKEKLEKELGLPVYLEPEFMTSMHAAIGLPVRRTQTGEKKGEFKKEALDASAAALILQRYLDKRNN
ncbi:MAG: Holliday junction resolvase RuvX [Patescibacteria group bacterium]|nr:MAG: Holliday junction resolvase RuvX [Patescibacteria group bacterium]